MIREVDAYIDGGHKGIRFPANIESLFNEKRRRYRSKAMLSSVAPSILGYNVFLLADWFLAPTSFLLSASAHAFITGWFVVVSVLLKSRPSIVVRELLCISMPILMVIQVLSIYVMNEGQAAAADYQYLVLMIVVFMNVNLRPDFRFALGASLFLITAYVSVVLSGHAAFSTMFVGTASIAAAAYLTLVANWRMERDARHAFLRGLQDRLHREEAEAEAGCDPLTGLFNRRYLSERSGALWAAVSPSTPMAVLMLDVDHFKGFNDLYGHLEGDLCLKSVAASMMAERRDTADLCVRFGGEEFVLLLPNTDLVKAIHVAERVRRAVEDHGIVNGAADSRRVSVSVGVASGSASTMNLVDLTAKADAALYVAKRSGRNQVWPPLMSTGANVIELRNLDRARVA